MIEIEQTKRKYIELYGEIKFNKILRDISKSKHSHSFVEEAKIRNILPDGDSFVACVMSNWKYGFGSSEKVLVASYILLEMWVGKMVSAGFRPDPRQIEMTANEIAQRCSLI